MTRGNLEAWVTRKRQEVRDAEPLSIQANISALSQRLWVAEQQLAEIRRFVDAFDDDVPVEYLRRILDRGSDEGRVDTSNWHWWAER